jgi:uncharacterized protein (DUF362 family)
MALLYLKKTEDRESSVREILERKEIRKEIEKAKKILLKPNIVSFESYPTTTHPELLEALLEILLGWQKEVLIADGPAFDAGPSRKVIESHSLRKVCKRFGLPLIDLNSGKMRKVKTESFNLEMAILPFEVDYIISLPVLKSHSICGLTGALKNQFGLLSPREKKNLHLLPWKNLHLAIAEINKVIRCNLWIVDAIETLIFAQERRHGGKVRKLGWMLAGKDPLLLDIEGLKLLQKVEPRLKDKTLEDILHLKFAKDLMIS